MFTTWLKVFLNNMDGASDSTQVVSHINRASPRVTRLKLGIIDLFNDRLNQ